jgi:glycerol-3-phosphate acyltransferase PlsY
MILDIGKGFLPYFLAYRFAGKEFIYLLDTTNNSIVAMLAGVAAVAGHNYSPYMKFKGGKGIATWLGFLLAAHPYTIPCVAVGMFLGLFVAKNMIWAVTLSIIFSSTFLWIYRDSIIYLLMLLLLIIIMIPKQINYSIKLSTNFKFRKEATVKDLFTPKIR